MAASMSAETAHLSWDVVESCMFINATHESISLSKNVWTRVCGMTRVHDVTEVRWEIATIHAFWHARCIGLAPTDPAPLHNTGHRPAIPNLTWPVWGSWKVTARENLSTLPDALWGAGTSELWPGICISTELWYHLCRKHLGNDPRFLRVSTPSLLKQPYCDENEQQRPNTQPP